MPMSARYTRYAGKGVGHDRRAGLLFAGRFIYDHIMLFRLGELFSGPGGLAVGAMQADIGDPQWGIVHQWATDFDPDTVETYRRNITPDAPESVILRDVRELPMEELARHGDIDALAFGFPCNDFSVVGEQRGLEGTYGPLYTYGAKALETFQPMWFLAENVSGLQNASISVRLPHEWFVRAGATHEHVVG